jgi:hypothetical protein
MSDLRQPEWSHHVIIQESYQDMGEIRRREPLVVYEVDWYILIPALGKHD